uniref:EF-hand domain-containing protein n=1 Tax=Noctiluca scintillans TaxID=2966 RepID=A0A7S1FCZ5_NOCSC
MDEAQKPEFYLKNAAVMEEDGSDEVYFTDIVEVSEEDCGVFDEVVDRIEESSAPEDTDGPSTVSACEVTRCKLQSCTHEEVLIKMLKTQCKLETDLSQFAHRMEANLEQQRWDMEKCLGGKHSHTRTVSPLSAVGGSCSSLFSRHTKSAMGSGKLSPMFTHDGTADVSNAGGDLYVMRPMNNLSVTSLRSERIRKAYDDTVSPGARRSSRFETQVSQRRLSAQKRVHEVLDDLRVMKFYRIEAVVKSREFGLFVCFIICLNALFIGISSDITVKDSIEQYDSGASASDVGDVLSEGWLFWVDISFNVIFLSELILRVVALEGQFCVGKEWMWNLFDAVVLAVSLFETTLAFMGISPGYFRLLRLARGARSLRMLRLMRFTALVRKLRMITLAVVHCKTMLLWAVLVLLLEIFLFSVVFANAATSYIVWASPGDSVVDEMKTFFGSIMMTMLTLFMSVTGGLDWWEPVRLLLEVHVGYGVVFLIYVVITVLAVLNIISAIFVNEAMEAARMDVDLRMQAEHDQTQAMLQSLTSIFKELSPDGEYISQEDFVEQVQREDMRVFCSFVGLQQSDMETLFQLLDVDGSGHVSIHEFVVGCLRLKGSAMLIEMDVMMHEIQSMMRAAISDNRRHVQATNRVLASVTSISPKSAFTS